MKEKDEFITKVEAAHIMHCSPATVVNLEKTGELPAAVKTANGMRIFSKQVVLKLAEERKQNRRKIN
jgi:DNA-binding transcriptional MerR regulator